MILRSKSTYPIILNLNLRSHWGDRPWTPAGVYSDGTPRYRGVQHDECPKLWPWWRLIAFTYCNLDSSVDPVFGVHPPSSGRRLWIYTRWGSIYGDIYIDRRPS
jgi:hypothetical protein